MELEKPLTDYCPFDCPRKKEKIFLCMKRFFKVIERWCPLFNYTEEERNKVFKEMEEQSYTDLEDL
ncbi:MAG: hypothetical protein ACYS0I_16595 [Planctomycetota bacterium]|jgi:hypothetical protein